jgi:hypothetical protein
MENFIPKIVRFRKKPKRSSTKIPVLKSCWIKKTHLTTRTGCAFRSIMWVRTKEDGKCYEAAIPRIKTGQYEASLSIPEGCHDEG